MGVDLSEAMEYHRRGRLDEAASLYEAALSVDSDDPEALHLLGLVSLQRGDPRTAEALISRAAALEPGEPSFHASLAEVYWALGQLERALASGRAALRLDPDNPEVLCNLGSTLASQGEFDLAIDHLRAAIRLRPDLAPAHNNLADALRLKGDKAAALRHFREAVRLEPASAPARSNLGEMLLALGETKEALEHCQEAVRLRPGFAPARHNLGNVLLALGRLADAEAGFREAIRLDPGLAAAHAGLGEVFEQLGEFDRSEASLRAALRLDPRHAGALARLATRLRARLPERDLDAILNLVDDPRLPDDARSKLQFGLAHVLDAQGRFDQAAALSTEANALQRADLEKRGATYDSEAHRRHIDALIAAFTPEFFARARTFGTETDLPVFVVGLPRSGTSLCEQVLASHPRVFGAGELRLAREMFEALPSVTGRSGTPLQNLQYLDGEAARRLARVYLDGLDALDRAADRVVDKMPENTQFLGLIAALFPRAKVIYCRRDVRDVALSCWLTEFGLLRWGSDMGHIATRIEEHRRLMAHWRRVLPIPLLEVEYEAMVNNLESEARKLLAFCGLEWHPAALEFYKTRRPVRTPSTAGVRQPVYTTSVGRFRNYERSLTRLFEGLTCDPRSGWSY
jgi:tetratricopeptide (TPR) repeat protein